MQFEIVLLFAVVMVVFIFLGLAFKNFIFCLIGAIVSIFLGISLAGDGVTFTNVVNDALTDTVFKGGFVAASGALLILVGIYMASTIFIGIREG